jgi:hypothetical protein
MHKRIIGSAIIMVLTVSQVVFSFPFNLPEVKQAHAATRLGLHVTQEELNKWKQRRTDNSNGINGSTYKQIWDNRILPDANNFRGQSHPGGDGYWEGWTGSGCYPKQTNVPQPGRSNGHKMLKSAFVFLLTGDTSYADPVRSELLNQIAQQGVDFGDINKWCVYNFDGNTFDVSDWVMIYLHAYDYLTAGGYNGFTNTQKANILNWFRNAGNYYMAKADAQIYENVFHGARNPTPDYTCNGWGCPGDPTNPTHWQGYTVYGFQESFSARSLQGAWMAFAAGLLTNDSWLIERGKRTFRESIMFSVFPDGTPMEMNRWRDGPNQEVGAASSWGHMMGNVGPLISMADILARTGDTSLYTFSTTEGQYGTQGGPKSLEQYVVLMSRLVNGTVNRYGSDNGTINADTKIDPYKEGGHTEYR